MAEMDAAARAAVYVLVMQYLSANRIECGLTKAQLRTAIDVLDAGLEAAEAAIVSGAGPAAKTWLQEHQATARAVLAEVAQTRAEVL